MPKGDMNCDICKDDILPENGYVEIDETIWLDESEGQSRKYVYCKSCWEKRNNNPGEFIA